MSEIALWDMVQPIRGAARRVGRLDADAFHGYLHKNCGNLFRLRTASGMFGSISQLIRRNTLQFMCMFSLRNSYR